MRKIIYITTKGVADDYRHSLVPLIIQNLGYRIIWNHFRKVDLLIFGPFYKKEFNYTKIVPKPLRNITLILEKLFSKDTRPIVLFQTGENIRHNFMPSDFSISFDLAVNNKNHYRLPYWMEVLNWESEGIIGNKNPRYGELLEISKLMSPLGNSFLNKRFAAAFISSHITEPRMTLLNKLKEFLPVTGYGPHFNKEIKDHTSSDFTKKEILKQFRFNLCPENSLYPGYYTEKIPEAFASDCLPITWADINMASDFNPNSILNLLPMMHSDMNELNFIFNTKDYFNRFCDEKLILKTPSIEDLKKFVKNIILSATS